MGKKVIAAMSGGVDSSAAAALLIEQGYDVVGVTLNVWPSERSELTCSRTCCSITDVDDARHVCNKLGIPHYVLNMRDIFKHDVIDYFFEEYMKGRTPNPCIACNAHVKFEAMLQKAEALGADYIATGHYSTIVKTPQGEFSLKRSKDTHKDQTYVLYMLDQRQLSKLLLPCGGFTKPEVRAVAERYGLPNFKKPDSQDLCFVGPEGYAGFIKNNCAALARPGNILKKNGEILGKHNGIYNFTIGQHKGLGAFSSEKLFVTAIDAETATVYVGESEDLFCDTMLVNDLRYVLESEMHDGARVGVKIRYSAKEAGAVLHIDGDSATVVFDEPQRAITPGQAAVFYKDDIVLGGGVIVRALN
jgi:tRNA-uridine 2-sulfurtransferase